MTLCSTPHDVQIFQRVAGDTGPPIGKYLDGVTDLVNANSFEARIWRKHAATVVIPDPDITLVDAATREISIDIESWLATATWQGDWKIAVTVTFLDTSVWTWPWDVIRLKRIP